jgi:phosphopantothenoylcysteine synthetase/decarboxylase
MNRAKRQLVDYHAQITAINRNIVYLLSGSKEICKENLVELASELERVGNRLHVMSERLTAKDLED